MSAAVDYARAVLVADIGGTHIRLGHISAQDKIQLADNISSDCLRSAAAEQVLTKVLKDYASEHRLTPDAVVLGIPGVLDADRHTITHCNNIRQLEGHGLRTRLLSALHCPVYLEQDIMLQLLGEWRSGAATGSEAVYGVYFGTGIGTACLLNGDPFRRGASTLQAGHIPVSNQGKRCLCGNTDCAEAYASGHTLKALAEQHAIPIDLLFTSRNNPALRRSLDEFIHYQSVLLASIITIAAPDRVLIGGGIPTMPGYPREHLEHAVRRHLQKPAPAETIELRWALHPNTAALYGAAQLIDILDHRHKE